MVATPLILVLAAGILSAGGLDLFSTPHSGSWLDLDVFAIEERTPLIDLRRADWQETEGGFKLRAGEEWRVDSPRVALSSGSSSYSASISSRQSYLRIERDLAFSDGLRVTVQGSLDQYILAELPSDSRPGDGLADWPQMQGRVAFTLGVASRSESSWACRVTSAFEFIEGTPPPLNLPPESDACFEASSLGIDLRFPLGGRAGLGAHGYTGIKLSPLFEGLGQDVWFHLPQPVQSTGGWFEVWFDWTPECHSRFGIGIDDPANQDGYFSQRHLLFSSLSIDLTDQLKIGCDVACRARLDHDHRVGEIPGDALRAAPDYRLAIDWMVQYRF
jgi:hypothetical protein